MTNHLSTSQVAKLLGTSVYNIRYYEKEGLLPPPQKSDKGYRLFSFKDIDMLAAIMMMRHSEVPIKDIKKLVEDYNPEKFIEYMRRSSSNIEAEIARLQKVKKSVDKVVEGYSHRSLGYFEQMLEKRYILPIKTAGYDEDLNEKELYDFTIKLESEIGELSSIDLYSILDYNEIIYCLEVPTGYEGDGAIEIPKGRFLCYRFQASATKDFEKEAYAFLRYIEKNKLKAVGELYLRELNVESFYYEDTVNQVHEYQILIDE